MKRLLLAFVLAAGACAPGAIGGGGDDDDFDNPDPDTPGPGEPDPADCVGDGSEGAPCEVTADCNSPTVCVNGLCVGPQDPSVTCDPVEGIFCAGENEQCVAGVCVEDPGVPGSDECSLPGPGPDLAGTWSMDSTLHLRDGLPGLVEGFLDVSEVARDLIDGNIDLGLPAPVEVLIGGIIADIIDAYVPDWAQELVQILAGFSDVLDDLQIDQTVVLQGLPCDANYRGSSTWDWITFEYRGMVVTERPENISEIGPVEPEDFGARYSCGQLFIDRHRVHNALRGLIRWMLDTLVEITTGYSSIEDALDAAVDCAAIAGAINDAWQSACGCTTDISGTVEATCAGYKADILADITTLIDEAAIELSVVSLEGITDIPDGNHMTNGIWHGELLSRDFPGEFSAVRQ